MKPRNTLNTRNKDRAGIAEIRTLAGRIGRRVRLMEVCGTHTMAAFRTGLRSLLPENVALLSGPGCPVCVTPESYLDGAIAVAKQPGASVATFGDMVRVPGSEESLETARAAGADVRVVYSPTDALNLAKRKPGRNVVFLGVGFETTTPTVAWTLKHAKECGVSNYSVLCAHKTIPEAMTALIAGGEVNIDGFMCPGHVSVITGAAVYEVIAEKFGIPCVVAGFEAGDMVTAIRMLLQQIADNRAEVEIEYTRSVTLEGNVEARALCDEVMEKCDAEWRGLGVIPGSGLRIRDEFSAHDAGARFAEVVSAGVSGAGARGKGCVCGDVLRGVLSPIDCGLFGSGCTPANPVGPCMVSSEGTCAAHYKYGIRLRQGYGATSTGCEMRDARCGMRDAG